MTIINLPTINGTNKNYKSPNNKTVPNKYKGKTTNLPTIKLQISQQKTTNLPKIKQQISQQKTSTHSAKTYTNYTNKHTDVMLILTQITTCQPRVLLKNPSPPPEIPIVTHDCSQIWVKIGRYDLVLGVTGSLYSGTG